MKQKGILQRVICMLLIICCTATCFNANMVQAQAAEDVTNSVSGKRNIKALCKFFSIFYGVELTHQMEIGQKKKYDFSKESARRYVLCISGDTIHYERISVKKASKRIFGKSTSRVGKIIGELGDGEWPTLKIKKIYKLSSGKYKVNISLIQFNGDTGIGNKTGELNVILKKKPKSYYGYIVKSMTLKKVSDIL